MFAIFSQIAPIRIDHRCGIEVNPGHLFLVNWHDQHHAMLARDLPHKSDPASLRNTLGKCVPAYVMFGATRRTMEQLLQTNNFHAAAPAALNNPETLVA